MSNKPGNYKINEKDSWFVRLVKNLIKPKPLNAKFREKFNLNEDYKLVYWILNERLVLLNYVSLNLLFPTFMTLVSIFAYAEFTGKSKMKQSFENPYEFIGLITAWFTFLFILARKNQSTTIFRIYHNEKENKFALVRLRNLLKFEKEEFKSENVKLKFDLTDQKPINRLVQNLNRNIGNVYINNKLKNVDFHLFKSKKDIESFLGTKTYENLKANNVKL